jgi:hypothetical protein
LSDQERHRAHKARDGAIDREQWRRSWIMRFVERQRVARRWIALVDLVDWCAQSTARASVAEENEARVLAYQRLTESILMGEFEREGTSKILYLVPDVFDDDGTPRLRLTREKFDFAVSIGSAPDLLRRCWLLREMARRWIETHGYHWPPHFEPAMTDSATTATGAPGRPSKSMHLIRGEFERRIDANTCMPSLRKEATELGQWCRRQHPLAPFPTRKTIENNIRTDYRTWQAGKHSTEP